MLTESNNQLWNYESEFPRIFDQLEQSSPFHLFFIVSFVRNNLIGWKGRENSGFAQFSELGEQSV